MTVATETVVEPVAEPVKTDAEVFYSKEPEVTSDSEVVEPEAKSTPESVADSPEPMKEPTVDTDVAIEYDLALKEGSFLKDSDIEEIKNFAKENKLSNEVAKAMLEGKDKAVSEYANNLGENFEKQIETWQKEVESDSELGGNNLPKTQERAKIALDTLGSDELKTALLNTGYQNFPPLVKFLSKIGSLLQQDSIELNGAAPAKEQSIEDIFYQK